MLTAEMVAQLKGAMEKFNGTAEQMAALEAKVDDLSLKIMAQPNTPESRETLGEWSSEKSAHDFIDFMKEIRVGDPAVLKQMSEGVDSEGGYLVPDDFTPTLIRLIDSFGVIRGVATKIPMKRKELQLPTLVSGVTTYWVDENAAITPSQPVFGDLRLTLKKLACLVPSSTELLEDSTIEIANLLATLVAEAIAQEEDRVGLVGSVAGGDPFDGVLGDASVTQLSMGAGDTAFANMDADDLMDLIAQVPTSASMGARFWMHRTIFDIVRKLKDLQGNYIYQQPAGGQPGTIWGYPYTLNDTLPAIGASAADTPFVIFGNLKYLYMGDRRRLTVARSEHVGFVNDQIYWRWTERIGFKIAIGAALACLNTSAV